MNKGKFGCPICNIEFGDLKSWEMHVAGKKHQYNQHRAEVIRKREEHGLFIAGFPQRVHSEQLHEFLQRYGEVIDFYHNIEKRFVLATYKENNLLTGKVLGVDALFQVSSATINSLEELGILQGTILIAPSLDLDLDLNQPELIRKLLELMIRKYIQLMLKLSLKG